MDSYGRIAVGLSKFLRAQIIFENTDSGRPMNRNADSNTLSTNKHPVKFLSNIYWAGDVCRKSRWPTKDQRISNFLRRPIRVGDCVL